MRARPYFWQARVPLLIGNEYGSTATFFASASIFTYGEGVWEHGHIFGKCTYGEGVWEHGHIFGKCEYLYLWGRSMGARPYFWQVRVSLLLGNEYGSTAIFLVSASIFTSGEQACEHGNIFGKREYL